MAYVYERPDHRALDDLERVVRHAGEELAGWRRRCLRAETELQQWKGQSSTGAGGPDLSEARRRIADLEGENQQLRQRIEQARERVQALSSRLSFLEMTQGETA